MTRMLCDDLNLRQSDPEDASAIRDIHEGAFATGAEADLFEKLDAGKVETISLLAECNGTPAGHILLTALDGPVKAVALAPLAVLPRFREMQVGSALVRGAIQAAHNAGYQAIFVLGDPGYYERFGFKAGLATAFDVAWKGPHFMALELEPSALAGKSGAITYPPEFFSNGRPG